MTDTLNAPGLQPLSCILGYSPKVNSHNLVLINEVGGNAEFRSLKGLKKLFTIKGQFNYAAPLGDTSNIVLLVKAEYEEV